MHSKGRAKYAYLFIIPFFIVFVLFRIYPILYSLYLSFCSWSGLDQVKWVGLQNYIRLIESGYFFKSIWNTMAIWLLSIIPQLTIALILALILNERWIKGRHALMSVYYFPTLVTPVTIGVLFNMLFSYPGGAVNNILTNMGIVKQPINWAYSPLLARLVIGIAICWQNFGHNIIFLTAGLNSIPKDVYEAAEIDGANSVQRAFKITLPLMKPILVYILITSIIGGLQIFDIPAMFNDVPDDVIRTMVMYMYESAFERWQFGYGAACAYANFVIIAVFSLIALWLTSRKKEVA